MNIASITTRGVEGIHAPAVQVEVHLANGLPAFHLVGMAETTVKEARERVRSALQACGFMFPAKRITVNLAPADVPKSGGRFDLAIALGILIADGQLPANCLQGAECIGELGLQGELRAVRGILPAAIAAADAQQPLFLPQANFIEAQLAQGLQAYCANSLQQIVLHLTHKQSIEKATCQGLTQQRRLAAKWDDIIGQQHAKRALTVAAAGEHNLLMLGPPGTGKSLLASRMLALLPPLTQHEAIESAAVQSIKGITLPPEDFGQRPLRAPHHTATAAALTGGGSPPQPGEVSLAHNGILFLDELPEFGRSVLDGLREPLETGDVRIARAKGSACFPARFQLLAAMNPSPTGDIDDGRTSPDMLLRYLNRLSGPLLDRIDLQISVARPTEYLLPRELGSEDSAIQAQQQVTVARECAMNRQGKPNARLSNEELARYCKLTDANEAFLTKAAQKLQLSMRVFHRTLKVARTIADLSASPTIERTHLAEALGYRALDTLLERVSQV